MTYFLTPDLVPRLYDMSKTVPYVFMDDVYVTGLIASKLTDPPVKYRKLSVSNSLIAFFDCSVGLTCRFYLCVSLLNLPCSTG